LTEIIGPIDAVSIGTITVAVATAVLAGITYFYMRETRLMRTSAERPIFSLEPTLYVIGGRFYFLHLVNTGNTGNEIYINCSWKDGIKRFFVLSLGAGGRAFLNDIPIADIVEKKMKLSIVINCKDSRNNPYSQTLDIDFENYLDNDRKLAYQFDYLANMVETLDDIKKELRDIDRSLTQAVDSMKPYLKLDCKIESNPIHIGKYQKIDISISGLDDGRNILGAIVSYILTTPGGSKLAKTGITDESGRLVINYDVNQIYETGKYKLVIWSGAKYYRPTSFIGEFIAVEEQFADSR